MGQHLVLSWPWEIDFKLTQVLPPSQSPAPQSGPGPPLTCLHVPDIVDSFPRIPAQATEML